MENPTFRLEGVVKSKNETEDFEGPLALILLLLNKNKIEIRNIKISEILDQYLDYLEQWQKMDLEIASEFVSMASQLLYIKAKSLLVTEEEMTELESLMMSLEELQRRDSYAKIKSVLEEMRDLMALGTDMIVKPQEYLQPDKEYHYQHDKEDLVSALIAVLNREDFNKNPVFNQLIRMPARPVYSIEEKTEKLIMLLKTEKRIPVSRIFLNCKSRSELVAAFVALLDLCKNGNIIFTDSDGQMTAELSE